MIFGVLRLSEGISGRCVTGSIAWIVVGACIVFFLFQSYPRAKTSYIIQNLELPLNNFFANHKDNIIVNFDEDGLFYQLRPYLQLRTVRRIRTVDGLEAALREGESRFGFVVLKRSEPADPELRLYLSANYSSQLIGNATLEEYNVFDIRSSNR
jgi:hypothetical protein